jgi:hypothetical protein
MGISHVRKLNPQPSNGSGEESPERKNSCSETVPRAPVDTVLPNTELSVKALLDTGATLNLLSPSVYEKVLNHGVIVRKVHRQLTTAGNQVITSSLEVDMSIRISAGLPKPLILEESFVVADCGEDLLLGYPLIRRHGLYALFNSDQQPEPVSNIEVEDITPRLPCNQFIEDDEFQEKIQGTVNEFADLFDEVATQPADVPPFKIELQPGADLRAVPPRRLSPKLLESLRDEVQRLKDSGIIRDSVPLYSFPLVWVMVMVKKSDCSCRKCVTYRTLNPAIVDLNFLMLTIENTKWILLWNTPGPPRNDHRWNSAFDGKDTNQRKTLGYHTVK